jgi:hypothetical protein
VFNETTIKFSRKPRASKSVCRSVIPSAIAAVLERTGGACSSKKNRQRQEIAQPEFH